MDRYVLVLNILPSLLYEFTLLPASYLGPDKSKSKEGVVAGIELAGELGNCNGIVNGEVGFFISASSLQHQ